MNEKNNYDYIEHNLRNCIGGGQMSDLSIVIQPQQKESTLVRVSLEIIKRFPIKNIDKAKKLYEKIQKFHYDLEKIVNG